MEGDELMEADAHQFKFIEAGSTGGSAFHLSNTVDWSSVSAQIKNQTVVVAVREVVRVHPIGGDDRYAETVTQPLKPSS